MPQTQNITPSEFAPHLVAVLGRLTEFTPDKSVPMESTYAPVCEAMGVDEDAMGVSSNGTTKGTHRQIGLAMRQLRDKGVTAYAKRGHWCLTIDGAREARQGAGLTPVPEAPEAAPPERVAARTGAAEDVVAEEEEGAEVVRLPVARGRHPYSDDPYIRSLAVERVPCFGAYSRRSDVCKECPLVPDCQGAVSARKGEIAAQMDAQEAKAREDAERREQARLAKHATVDELIQKVGNEDSPKHQARTKGGAKGRFAPRSTQDVADAFAQRETECIQCHEIIPEDDPCLWVQDEGIFHIECVEPPEEQP